MKRTRKEKGRPWNQDVTRTCRGRKKKQKAQKLDRNKKRNATWRNAT